MATKRKRGETWEFCIRRKGLLPRPVYLTFKDEGEGDAYCTRIERLLDRGVVPEELQGRATVDTLKEALLSYQEAVHISAADVGVIGVIEDRFGDTRLIEITYEWAEKMIARLKQEWKLAPSTIRHHVGALARCLDWLLRKELIATNPLRALPKNYAVYNETDVEIAGVQRVDQSRERRLEDGEDEKNTAVLKGDMLLMYRLELETGMRMAELYTLDLEQCDTAKQTFFLDKTKNGDKRQVPMSSVALALIEDVLKTREEGPLFVELYEAGEDRRKATARLSRAFSRAFTEAGSVALHFHDLRHEFTCRLYEQTDLSDVEIAKILGWKSMRMALRYANLRGSKLAKRLW